MAVCLILPYDDARAIVSNPEFDKWITDVLDAEVPHMELVLDPAIPTAPNFREWRMAATFSTEMGAVLFRLRWL